MHLHKYTCTNKHTVCFDSWHRGETSLTGFICLCLSNSLSSLPWLILFGAFATCPSHPGHQEWCFPYCDHKGYHLPSHPSSCGTSPQCCCTQELFCHSPATTSAHSLRGSLHSPGTSTCPLPQAFLPLPQQEKC